MATRKTQVSKKENAGKKKPANADKLVGSKGKAELSEDELKDVSGGSFSWGIKID